MAIVPMKKVRSSSVYLIKAAGKSIKSSCIFTKDIDKIYLPVRHGEGSLLPEARAI
jgi:hypothetical protein